MSDANGRWIDVAALEDCPPGSSCEVVAGDEIVALFNVEGQFHALHGLCPHHGGPLGKGEVSGCIVTCPWHGWQFDVRDGTYQHSEQTQHRTFAARQSGARVEVFIPSDDIHSS